MSSLLFFSVYDTTRISPGPALRLFTSLRSVLIAWSFTRINIQHNGGLLQTLQLLLLMHVWILYHAYASMQCVHTVTLLVHTLSLHCIWLLFCQRFIIAGFSSFQI